ncbi:MAG: hypothetical protein ACJ754_14500 [Pyrinomonadaceae bacterium]
MGHDSTLQLEVPLGGFLRSPLNWLLLFVPVTVALEHVGPAPPPVLFFSAALAIVPIAVLIGALVCGDGQSNWYKGVQLVTVYAIIALMFYLIPALT